MVNAGLMRRFRAAGDDSGFAMVTVVGTMLVLTLFVVVSTTFAVNAMPQSRKSQDYAAAMAAAQSGIDDVLSRLNNCDTYWATPCGGSPAEPGRWDGNPAGAETNKWANVPGADGARDARYRYTLVSTPATTPNLIRVRADGEVNGVQRTITADLSKEGFLKYIYYTNYEGMSPELYQLFNGGSLSSAQARCGRYYYSVPPATGTRSSACDINFVGGDVVRGNLYTNDALLLMSLNGEVGPLFQGTTETNWRQEFNPGSNPTAPYRKNGSSSAPHPSGQVPQIAGRKVDMPASNTAIENAAQSGGCVYEGPTRIQLRSNGTVTVTSPLTSSSSLNSGCPLNATGSLPGNGVIYVKGSTTSCSGKPTAFPLSSDDVTAYECNAGTAFLEGTLKGALTVATQHDIIITDDVKYNTQAVDKDTGAVNSAATDVLGLVAQGSVQTYHPVTSGRSNIDAARVRDLRIDAAILSVENSFTVQNFNRGGQLGTLTVAGGIYQNYRGPVGSSGSNPTGYLKNYLYDSRLLSLPPPHFLTPVGSAWQIVGFSE